MVSAILINVLSPPSSRGLGRCPFKAKTGIRIPLGAPNASVYLLLNVARHSALLEHPSHMTSLNSPVLRHSQQGRHSSPHMGQFRGPLTLTAPVSINMWPQKGQYQYLG